MRIDGGGRHLTYCTNIHPGNGWAEVFGNVRAYAPRLKAAMGCDGPFGLGLRLSAEEAGELLADRRLPDFQGFLAGEGLYVALLNGYPFGPFHNQPVKAEVFAPDWRERSRLEYTLRLLEILTVLLPEGVDGGISTLPLSYKRWIAAADRNARLVMVRNVAAAAAAMADVRRRTGRLIHLDIEPEPDGLLETSAEAAAFFTEWLQPEGAPLVSAAVGVPLAAAGELLREHVRVCFDACHFAVEYEEPENALRTLEAAGVQVGRVQISSALRVRLPGDAATRAELAERLAAFADPVYLHQVVERGADGSLRRYADLPEALAAAAAPGAREWRIHFHVPLFAAGFGAFESTQDEVRKVLQAFQARPSPRHLEIETYTWSVLPPEWREELSESLAREYRWTLAELCGRPPSSTLSA